MFGTGYIQVLYLGRAPCTKETLPDFREKCRVTRHPRVFRGLTGSQRTPGFWGVTLIRTLYILNTGLLNPTIASKDTIANDEVTHHPSSTVFAFSIVSTNMIKVCLWHRCLGHASITALLHISFLSNKDLQNIRDCNICPLAKQHRLHFSTSEIFTTAVFLFVTFGFMGFLSPKVSLPQPSPKRMKGVRNYTGTLYLLFQTLVSLSLINKSKCQIQGYKIKLPP